MDGLFERLRAVPWTREGRRRRRIIEVARSMQGVPYEVPLGAVPVPLRWRVDCSPLLEQYGFRADGFRADGLVEDPPEDDAPARD